MGTILGFPQRSVSLPVLRSFLASARCSRCCFGRKISAASLSSQQRSLSRVAAWACVRRLPLAPASLRLNSGRTNLAARLSGWSLRANASYVAHSCCPAVVADGGQSAGRRFAPVLVAALAGGMAWGWGAQHIASAPVEPPGASRSSVLRIPAWAKRRNGKIAPIKNGASCSVISKPVVSRATITPTPS